jgi:phage terminase large subunit
MKIHKPKRYEHIVMGGWLDKAEGVIFPNWSIGKFDESLPTVYGMDFGYVNDPTVLIKVAQTKQKIYTKGLLYEKGMSTDDIINFLEDTVDKEDLIIADSAEPRLIAELQQAGFNIFGCKKGKDSIKNGLAKMYVKEIIVEEDDVELHKELNNYQWHDKKSNIPMDSYNHYVDAMRYAHEELFVDNEFFFG